MSTKCFNCHILSCLTSTENGLELFGRLVEFVWIQGVVTDIQHAICQLTIDDGTNSIIVIGSSQDSNFCELSVGEYVLVQGAVVTGEDESTGQSVVLVESRIVSPVRDPNMESIWFMEVISSMSRT
jgi:hypothetical protein